MDFDLDNGLYWIIVGAGGVIAAFLYFLTR